MWVGDFRLGDTLDLKFCTVSTTGAPTTLAGTPVISAYPGNSTTQLTAGITLSVDFDGVTGLHNVRVAATSGNGYATATNYALVITTGTVGGTSVVGYVVGHFSVENRSAVMPTTATRTLDVSAGGEAGVDWANVGSPTTAVDLSGTTIKTTQKVDVDTIKTNPVVNAGTITFPTTATLASTTNITAGTVTTATNVTTVNGLAANVITATAINADAITAAKVADGTIDAATFAAGAITAAAVADGAIDRATFAADTGLQTIRSGTCQAGSTLSTLVLDAGASATDDDYKGLWAYVTGGAGVGQIRLISAYTGASQTASTVPNWKTQPDGTSTFALLPITNVPNVGNSSSIGNVQTCSAVTTVSGNVGGNVTGSVGSISAGGIAAASFAAGAIDAAAIAANAIGASELAADAVAEIADAIWDEATADHQTAGTTGKALTDAGGAGTPPTAAAIADAVWDEANADHRTNGTTGAKLFSGMKIQREQ